MATKRRPIKLGVRFEIFKRDAFTCQYCGKRPPEALLEVDHIVPVSKGGGNEEGNLITSCAECNRGKSARPLGEVVPSPSLDRAADIEERALQARAYAEALSLRNEATNVQIDLINSTWCDVFGGTEEGGVFRLPRGIYFPKEKMLRVFLRKLPLERILEAIDITASRSPTREDVYFYGVCWRMIRGEDM